MKPSIVVFDIGAVLVDWQPTRAWADELGSEKAAQEFIDRTNFMALNKRADNGEAFADLALEVTDPGDRQLFNTYISRFQHTVRDAVPGTWSIVDQLLARNVPLHGITNWSAETWPEGLKAHPRLDEIFGTLVISGREKMSKPEPGIYQLLCERADVAPEDCVFIDDGLRNVKGAMDVGMDGIHFTDAAALARELSERGLL